jgi:hypothetical protein
VKLILCKAEEFPSGDHTLAKTSSVSSTIC